MDDDGVEAGPVTVYVPAHGARHVNSEDLEFGNASKLEGLLGSPSSGDWRLLLETDLSVAALAYVRTEDGFLTSLNEPITIDDGWHYVPTFNPGSNRQQRSLLRLENLYGQATEVSIRGIDDKGQATKLSVIGTLQAKSAVTLTAEELEEGPTGWSGSLGDGDGKWRLLIPARGFYVMSLLEDPKGYLTSLSTSQIPSGGVAAVVARLPAPVDTGTPAVPAAPRVSVDRVTATEIFLEWPPVPNATQYNVYIVRPDGTATALPGGPWPSIEVPPFRVYGLTQNTEYCYTVTALNGSAESAHSARVCANTDSENADGTVNFVALGYEWEGRAIVSSGDGVQWDTTYVATAGRALSDVSYGGGHWTVVGNGIILRSSDGRSWTAVVDTDWTLRDHGNEFHNLKGVAYGNGIWTAVGYNAILRSTDGRDWSTVYGEASVGVDPNLNGFLALDVDYGNGLWVALTAIDILESSDGTTWAALPDERVSGCPGGRGRSRPSGIGDWRTLTFGAGHWHTTNFEPISWHMVCSRTRASDWEGRFEVSGHLQIDSAAYGAGYWVGCGKGPNYEELAVWEAGGDSIYWTELPDSCWSLVHHNGLWVASTSGGIYHNRGDPKGGGRLDSRRKAGKRLLFADGGKALAEGLIESGVAR